MFGKIENGKLVICPRNGYVSNNAISNIDVYFQENPEIAKKEGWLPIKFAEDFIANPVYFIKNNVIVEQENE